MGGMHLLVAAAGTRADPVIRLTLCNGTTDAILVERELLLADVVLLDDKGRELEQATVPGSTTRPSPESANQLINLRSRACIQRDIHFVKGAKRLTCATVTRFEGQGREDTTVVSEDVRRLRSCADVSRIRSVKIVYGSLCGDAILDEIFMKAGDTGHLFAGPLFVTADVRW